MPIAARSQIALLPIAAALTGCGVRPMPGPTFVQRDYKTHLSCGTKASFLLDKSGIDYAGEDLGDKRRPCLYVVPTFQIGRVFQGIDLWRPSMEVAGQISYVKPERKDDYWKNYVAPSLVVRAGVGPTGAQASLGFGLGPQMPVIEVSGLARRRFGTDEKGAGTNFGFEARYANPHLSVADSLTALTMVLNPVVTAMREDQGWNISVGVAINPSLGLLYEERSER
jgi:hypothetical protein